MEIIVDNISEVEKILRATFPPILYKYRDWDSAWHQDILKKSEIWLSHPKKLNDDLDIRIPYQFKYEEIYSPHFFEMLKDYASKGLIPAINPNSQNFQEQCKLKLEKIKQNPVSYFINSYNAVYNGNLYDCIGVLSLTENPLSRIMWAHYGNTAKGFCIGFDTIELYKDIMPIDPPGKIDYVCEATSWSFLNAEKENLVEWLFKKHVDWSYESEYRFVTTEINDDQRERKFKDSTIKEVLVGANISDENLQNIIEILKQQYNSKVDLYRAVRDASSYRIGKQKISY